MSNAKIGFELRRIQVPIDHILPVRQIKDPMKSICRYRAILVSVKEVGLIEPLMVYPQALGSEAAARGRLPSWTSPTVEQNKYTSSDTEWLFHLYTLSEGGMPLWQG